MQVVRAGLIAAVLLTVASCGGGGGGSSNSSSSGVSQSSGSSSSGTTPAAPAIVYASPSYSFTAGVNGQIPKPSLSGGAVSSWSVSPDLPSGLSLDATDGSISGAPSAASAAAYYAVTATNPGGKSTATLKLVVVAAPVIDFGIGSSVVTLRMDTTRVLAQDSGGRWVLWDYATRDRIALGSQPCYGNGCAQIYPIDYAAPIFAIGTPTGLEVRSSATGTLLATIATTANWWKLASDGSYVCGGDKNGLTVWSPSGAVVATRSGDYSTATVAATPGAVLVANGPAGANVIEAVASSTGSSTLSASFAGTFAAWFTDNSAFLAADSSLNALRVYSPAGVMRDQRALPPYTTLGGVGQWFYAVNSSTPSGTMSVYRIGNSASATATYGVNAGRPIVASGTTVATWGYGSGPFDIIDLSGTTPTEAQVPTAPEAYILSYAAVSATQWVVGDSAGAALDGPSSASTPRLFGYGAPTSIAGGTQYYAVAAASGTILYFDVATNTLQGQIPFNGSDIQMSANGTVLAAQATGLNAQFSIDRTVNVYSLPSGALINSFPSSYSTSAPFTEQMTLSASGTLLGEVDSSGIAQEVAVANGAVQWTNPTPYRGQLLLSPDGTGIAITNRSESDIGFGVSASTDEYVSGNLVANLPGIAVGWLDNAHLLVNNFDYNKEAFYTNSQIYGKDGIVTGAGPVPYVLSFQRVMPATDPVDLVYLPTPTASIPGNVILSLGSSHVTWASGNPSAGGAVAGTETVFVSGSRLLAQPH